MKSWDDYMDAIDALPRTRQLHARQVFDIMLDKERTAQELAKYGVPCPLAGAESPTGEIEE